MKSRLSRAVCACAVSCSIMGAADAAFVLSIDDLSTAGVDVTISDGDASDSSPAPGSIVYNGAVGAFTVVVSTGTSKPLVTGNPQLLDLNSVQVSGATGQLKISLTDTDYVGAQPAFIKGLIIV